MAIRYLDGTRLQRTFIAAANAVNSRRDHLNAINVFPVPDGDTGTNMAATLVYAADGIAHLQRPTIMEIRAELGRAVLVGARGNSGFIMAQFIRGFLDGVGQEARRIHASQLVAGAQEGARRAYDAIMEPVEGTILTVMREWSRGVVNLGSELRDLKAILDGALERASLALENTREQMALLKEHDVVDAGAQGFVHMLEGIQEFMHRGTVHTRRPESLPDDTVGAEAAEQAGELEFRYCTQILLEKVDRPVSELQQDLHPFGDSLIISGDSELMKVHIHTNEPDLVLDLLEGAGTLLDHAADDMQAQAEAVAASRPTIIRSTSKQTVALVLDSASDLDPQSAAESGIHVVPCRVIFGEEDYRDGVDLKAGRFYEMLRTHPEHPRTSQPATGDFVECYQEVLERYDHVLSVHIAASLSGTYQAAVQAAKEVDADRIQVVDSGTLSLTVGLMGIALARLAGEGMGLEALRHRAEEMTRHSRLYCMLDTLEYLVRGGRISRLRGWVGRTLGVLPILTVHDGGLETVCKVRTPDRGLEEIFSRLADEIPEGAPVIGAAAHADNPAMCSRAAEMFVDRFAPQQMIQSHIGPAIGSHAGPGAWGVYYLIGSTG